MNPDKPLSAPTVYSGGISKSDSLRLNLLRFPLIVGVVFIHVNNDYVMAQAPEGGLALWVHWIRSGGSMVLAAVSVPLFFLLSGYLFFSGKGFTTEIYARKAKSRVRTLLIPYVFWNVALACVFFLATKFPQTESLLSGKKGEFLAGGMLKGLGAVFGLQDAPVAYQFWFIRDLMIAVLLAPLFHLFHKRWPLLWLMLLAIPWLLHCWPLQVPGGTGLLFFYLGSVIAVFRHSMFALDPHLRWFLGAYGIVLCIEVFGWLSGNISGWFLNVQPALHSVGILVGIVCVLGLTARVAQSPRLAGALQILAGSAFFLFATHEPLLTIFGRVANRLTGESSPLMELMLYLSIPILTILACVAAHRLLQRVLPRLTALMTGGR